MLSDIRDELLGYGDFVVDVDEYNIHARKGQLTKTDRKFMGKVCDLLDKLPMTPPLCLYRGLSEFNPSFLNDKGIAFKAQLLPDALIYAEGHLLVMNYSIPTKQLNLDLYFPKTYPGEPSSGTITYPNEIFSLTKTEVHENTTYYYCEYQGRS
jgi:hypothetical protein